MKGSYVVLGIELEGIKSFLRSVENEAGVEIRNIMAKHDSGELQGEEELENALYHPMIRQEIAARAVFYELSSLIEHELQRSAHPPRPEASKKRGKRLRMIQDMSFPELRDSIETMYGIRMSELAGAEGFLKTKDMVNSFKHRKGLRDYRKEDPKPTSFPSYHESDTKRAYEAIENAFVFIEALWHATERQPALVHRHTK